MILDMVGNESTWKRDNNLLVLPILDIVSPNNKVCEHYPIAVESNRNREHL